MSTLRIMYIAFSLLLIALSIPLIREKVRPNPWYGFRVKATLENPRLWYAVNRYAGVRLLITGIGTVVAALVLSLIPAISVDAYALACLAVFLLFILPGMVQSVLFLRKQERL